MSALETSWVGGRALTGGGRYTDRTDVATPRHRLREGLPAVPNDSVLRAAMQALSESLRSGPTSLDDALSLLTKGALDALPAWEYASISRRSQRQDLETLAATVDWVSTCDQMQSELREGPCYEALREETFSFSGDLREETRWPRYAPRALEMGVRAQMAIDLAPANNRRASLNLYAMRPVEMDAEMLEVARLFASSAGGALGLVQHVRQLKEAAESRRRIGQAVGIVMERYHLDEDRAFSFLVRLSQTTNLKLRVVAEQVVQGVDVRGLPGVE
jgi:ANTAR domain-containing protein